MRDSINIGMMTFLGCYIILRGRFVHEIQNKKYQIISITSRAYTVAKTPSYITHKVSPSDIKDEDMNNNSEYERVPVETRLGAISGAPLAMTQRTVRIFRPAKTAMQSGSKQTRSWRIEFDIQAKWENPLMGWTSSADPVQGLDLSFDTAEEASRFAERQGWNIRLDMPMERTPIKTMYAENFYYSPGPLRHIRTK